MQTITSSISRVTQTITLNRPEAKNAFNELMIEELRGTFTAVSDSVRAVVLTGEGNVFCAGADINWMRDSITRSEDDNRNDAARMESMFRAIDECPAPVIGRINGSALGGGMGLLACCDIAVSVDSAQFAFTEVRLGIVPAVISPYSLAKIGERAARRYFLTGELFDAARAKEIGLVHDVVTSSELDTTVQNIADSLAKNGPHAVRTAKQIIRDVTRMDRESARAHTTATIARVRTSPEGQEGLTAFLEKRKPNWLRK
jgi:methylglutaconyl-CoA hydratase